MPNQPSVECQMLEQQVTLVGGKVQQTNAILNNRLPRRRSRDEQREA